MGFEVSDVYDSNMMPGGAVFLRCNADHHGIALFKAPEGQPPHGGFHHMAFEVSTLDEVLRARDHLRKHDVPIAFRGPPPRRRADRGRVPRSGRPQAGDLLGYRPDRQPTARCGPPEEWKGAHSLEAAIADPVVGQDTTVQDRSLLHA